ncbi:hypothetical protein QL093DRAFT_2223864 [Fusarium oxysporum]|nr:hypothetical protein QL093DRAFT_2223864 [Fusarium oxysporum]
MKLHSSRDIAVTIVLYSLFICTVSLSTILGLEHVPGWGLEIASLLSQVLWSISKQTQLLNTRHWRTPDPSAHHSTSRRSSYTRVSASPPVIRKPPQMPALRSVRRSFSTD